MGAQASCVQHMMGAKATYVQHMMSAQVMLNNCAKPTFK
jgi:hypothetical protein